MGAKAVRFSVPVVISLVGTGLQVAGFEDTRVALGLWSVAGLWLLVALLFWDRLSGPMVSLTQCVLRLRVRSPVYSLVSTDDNGALAVSKDIVDNSIRLNTMLEDDKRKLINSAKGDFEPPPDFHNIADDANPFIDFKFRYFNGTVYDLEVGRNITGRIKYDGKDLPLAAFLPERDRVGIPRGHIGTLVLRQPLTKDFSDSLRRQQNQTISFNLDAVFVSLQAKRPDGNNLDADEMRFRLPQHCDFEISQEFRLTQ